MSYKFNPLTGKFDLVGSSESDADDLYVNETGDTMTGDLEFDTSSIGIILKSSSSGGSAAGSPMGLLMALTYASGGTKRWRVTVNDSGSLVTTEI